VGLNNQNLRDGCDRIYHVCKFENFLSQNNPRSASLDQLGNSVCGSCLKSFQHATDITVVFISSNVCAIIIMGHNFVAMLLIFCGSITHQCSIYSCNNVS